jgi:hypothetical protein
MKSSLTIQPNEMFEKFFVVKESYLSSITPYQESSVASSVVGFNTPLVFGIQTCGDTAVPLVVSFQSQIALCLQINASLIFLIMYYIKSFLNGLVFILFFLNSFYFLFCFFKILSFNNQSQ